MSWSRIASARFGCPASSVLTYNRPLSVDAGYDARFRGTFASALYVIAQIGWDHPRAAVGLEVRKIGFSSA